jgi:predicted RNA-binding protein with PIN domain
LGFLEMESPPKTGFFSSLMNRTKKAARGVGNTLFGTQNVRNERKKRQVIDQLCYKIKEIITGGAENPNSNIPKPTSFAYQEKIKWFRRFIDREGDSLGLDKNNILNVLDAIVVEFSEQRHMYNKKRIINRETIHRQFDSIITLIINKLININKENNIIIPSDKYEQLIILADNRGYGETANLLKTEKTEQEGREEMARVEKEETRISGEQLRPNPFNRASPRSRVANLLPKVGGRRGTRKPKHRKHRKTSRVHH